MNVNARKKPQFKTFDPLKDAFGMYGRSINAILPASCLYFLLPYLLIMAVLWFSLTPLIGNFTGYRYTNFNNMIYTMPFSLNIPPWHWVLAIGGILITLLLTAVWGILIYPKFAGGVVIAAGRAKNNEHVSFRDINQATNGGRYTQLIVLSLCLMLAEIAVSTVAATIITVLLTPVITIAAIFMASNGIFSILYIITISITSLITVIATYVPIMFLLLTYPAAIFENKRHFNAISASIRHVSRAYGRVFAGFLPYLLGLSLLGALVSPLILSIMNTGAYWALVPLMLIILIISAFATPFQIVYATAAYLRIREADGYQHMAINNENTGEGEPDR